jgi:hypothetical protein
MRLTAPLTIEISTNGTTADEMIEEAEIFKSFLISLQTLIQNTPYEIWLDLSLVDSDIACLEATRNEDHEQSLKQDFLHALSDYISKTTKK